MQCMYCSDADHVVNKDSVQNFPCQDKASPSTRFSSGLLVATHGNWWLSDNLAKDLGATVVSRSDMQAPSVDAA